MEPGKAISRGEELGRWDRAVERPEKGDHLGDIAGHFFREDGSFVDAWSSRTLAISVEEMRAAARVIAVAAGNAKAAPVLGALRTGLLDMLITDRPTAEAVLKLAGRPR